MITSKFTLLQRDKMLNRDPGVQECDAVTATMKYQSWDTNASI